MFKLNYRQNNNQNENESELMSLMNKYIFNELQMEIDFTKLCMM